MSTKTTFKGIEASDRNWHLVDASNLPVGRLASEKDYKSAILSNTVLYLPVFENQYPALFQPVPNSPTYFPSHLCVNACAYDAI